MSKEGNWTLMSILLGMISLAYVSFTFNIFLWTIPLMFAIFAMGFGYKARKQLEFGIGTWGIITGLLIFTAFIVINFYLPEYIWQIA